MLTFSDINALMPEAISAKVGQGIFWIFMYLLALWDGSSESFDAGHVLAMVGEVVLADIQTRQRPIGDYLGR